MEPLLEMPAGGVKFLNLAILAGVVLEVVLGVVLAATLDDGLLVGLIVIVASFPGLAVVALVVPTRYQIWATKLTIVFLFGRRWDVPYSSIESAAEARAWQPYAARGVRFATAPSQAITITRRNPRMLGRPNIVISPQDRSVFLPRLQQAMAASPEA